MKGKLTIYSTTGKGDLLTLRDVVDMIESVGGDVSFAEAGTIDFDLDAPLEATVDVNGNTFAGTRVRHLSFRVTGTDG
jgi:hypothetical protein